MRLWFPLIWYATCLCSKNVEFWPLELTPRVRGVCGQNICYCVADSWFPLIWYATWPSSEKVEFWPFDPSTRVGEVAGSSGEIFATTFLHLWFPLIQYATRPCSEKNESWPFEPTPWPGGGGGLVCRQNICDNVAVFVIPFNLMYNITL